jgi:Na+/H+ antiporter NhaA
MGFTMSIFITLLAFKGNVALIEEAKLSSLKNPIFSGK